MTMTTMGTPPATNNVLLLDKKMAAPAGPSVRTIARQQGIDLPGLIDILRHRRPDKSETEKQFVKDFLDVIPGMEKDTFGNRYIRVGTAPVMWSCHTDTVSDEGGMQNVRWKGDVLELNDPDFGQSLGADDGAGMWLLLEMLKVGREGLYIFHRAEEVGGIGSKWIAKNTPELIKDITMAIAFDRRGTTSVITKQRGRRSASDKFGEALAAKLNKTDGLKMKIDPTGVFTDTASYTELIAECTNISTGYYDEHSDRETLDVAHLLRLREALMTLDVTDLPIERDPTEVEQFDYGRSSYGGYGRSWGSNNWGRTSNDPLKAMQDMITARPYTVAKMLDGMGITPYLLGQMFENAWRSPSSPLTAMRTGQDDADRQWRGALADDLAKRGHRDPDPDGDLADDDVTYEEMLWCSDCEAFDTHHGFLNPMEGDECSNCLGRNTEMLEAEVNSHGELVS